MADEVLERVSMQWPKEVKEAVREKVGARGLTEFVLEAVNIHLSGESAETNQTHIQQINELKWLVQQLADRAAMGGDTNERASSMMELDLPEWLDTSGWPSAIAVLVKPIPAVECPRHPRTFVETGKTCRQCKLEDAAVAKEAEEGPAPIAPPVNEVVVPEDEAVVRLAGDDHLARVMEMARKKGVEMSSIDLKPASRIDPPPPTDAEAEEAIEVMEEVVAIATADEEDPNAVETEQLRREAASAAGVCGDCGGELIDGECWTCG